MRPLTFGALCCLFAFIALLFNSTARGAETEADPLHATCRITASEGNEKGVGSGCVFEASQGYVYVLTAGHVVAGSETVTCEFWSEGHQSGPIPGRVLARGDVDAAIVSIDAMLFQGRLPAVIPLAPEGTTLVAGDTLSSAGCANGAWQTKWEGHVLGLEGATVLFVPAPAGGRSGSAIVRGGYIVGVVVARTLNNSHGRAIAVPTLRTSLTRAVAARNARRDMERLAQCGPGGCPGGACPQPQQPPKYRVLPYRQKQEFKQQGGTWPTLPPQQVEPVKPAPPVVDIDIKPAPSVEPPRPAGANPLLLVVAALAGLTLACLIYFTFPR